MDGEQKFADPDGGEWYLAATYHSGRVSEAFPKTNCREAERGETGTEQRTEPTGSHEGTAGGAFPSARQEILLMKAGNQKL